MHGFIEKLSIFSFSSVCALCVLQTYHIYLLQSQYYAYFAHSATPLALSICILYQLQYFLLFQFSSPY